MKNLNWCSNCLVMSTRPRVTFDKNNLCNACVWSYEKKNYNWNKNLNELKIYLKKNLKKENRNNYDCIVPVSGGKDGSFVYDRVKYKLKLNPLAVTINPPLPQKLGTQNLDNFINSGVPLLEINPPYEAMRKLNFLGFKNIGFPYYGWLVAIQAGVVRIADNFGINLIFYGEDGELEYGGTKETKKSIFYDVNYQRKIYLENHQDFILNKSKLSKSDLYFFSYPQKINKIKFTHYSCFGNWNPYTNYLVAKKKYGLIENTKTNTGTFSNFAQNDQKLYALHTYCMYLKFGFGRATQDASIEIRRGAMKRSQGIELAKLYDNQYPKEYLKDYLSYFKISKIQFDKILDRWANKKLFYKKNNKWHPKFEIK